ncbi:tetratricopeptide repeat protein 17-like [Acanthaster planci]|uniref:Tetratricopeptide repeat protein 17-like n=1 Tax=Acanthaster planci TaxID=133434 RepID=A0A8B7YAM6_ACAPL|nr:tetratricopeptide repeat protein 17-like [Acanthaster planci]
MTFDTPNLTYMALYLVGASMVASTPRSATHWKLQKGEDGVVLVQPSLAEDAAKVASEDPVLTILTQQNNYDVVDQEGNRGDRIPHEGECVSCEKLEGNERPKFQPVKHKNLDALECTKHVNKTAYDSLSGIIDRAKHPSIPEPEVALIFKRSDSDQVDMSALEKSLRERIIETPNSLAVLNQVGNYWRIKGNTFLAIECFRKALSISPTNPDILLNLARVLFNAQRLPDALLLTQKSLQHKAPDQNAWLQHFTLGEVHKALGHYPEAGTHFRHSLDLNPTFQPAEAHLRDMEQPLGATNATLYTILIIGVLISAVCVVLYYVTEAYLKESNQHPRRSPKLAVPWDRVRFPIPPRLMKNKRGGTC